MRFPRRAPSTRTASAPSAQAVASAIQVGEVRNALLLAIRLSALERMQSLARRPRLSTRRPWPGKGGHADCNTTYAIQTIYFALPFSVRTSLIKVKTRKANQA